jgi:hypothetical protein
MESLLTHELFPHATGVSLLVALLLIVKCVKKACVAVCFLTGWISAALMLMLARHHLLRDMVDSVVPQTPPSPPL